MKFHTGWYFSYHPNTTSSYNKEYGTTSSYNKEYGKGMHKEKITDYKEIKELWDGTRQGFWNLS